LAGPVILGARVLLAFALDTVLEDRFPGLPAISSLTVTMTMPEVWAIAAAVDGVTDARESIGHRVRQDFAIDTIKDLMAGPPGSTVVVIERDADFSHRSFIYGRLADFTEELGLVVE